MINLLFLLATAQAADVFEFCTVKRQVWSEREQEFHTELINHYASTTPMQFIVYEKSFEIERDRHPIIETTTKNNMTCWREHQNSELCYDTVNKQILWEWNTRAGATIRDVMYICRKNGEQ